MRSGNKPDVRSQDGTGAIGNGGNGSRGGNQRNVGDALRAVYREAVDESIPDELLDLLKKLD